ncbi:MAG: hypothetical protein FWC21_06075 [Treponema sp.]|nr:hypothetical protein [Treponema sp.]
MEVKKTRKTDRRTVYTRKIIKDTLIGLLDEGTHAEKITVSRICKISQINRCTFYLHYSDVYSVLGELQKEVEDVLTKCVNASLSDESRRQDICGVLFASLRENKIYQVLSRCNLTSTILKRVFEYSKTLLANLCVETKQFKRREAELFALFLISGCAAVSEDQVFNNWKSFEKDNKFVTKILDQLYAMLDIGKINLALQRGKQ